ncbi:IS4 family transposase [Puniceicoccus vermicola]|uniref:IS4 family transposase n=1 Tax=Puniceicoccus vermicola TaxID=388746 RepID=A0A7X1E4X5_9BACT|nr:IS4 family transposase [Puniceicoccus vermicola]MBC2602524.1 IS4 family transposase [Puniceicoccus vermicola]
MNSGRLIFTQITDLIHREQFNRCIALHPMPRASKSMSARDQFLAMAFAQITFREILRDIEACLDGCAHCYAMGIRGKIVRTNLAYANGNRDWRVYEALAQILIHKARRLYVEDSNGLDIEEMVYALDASTIDLCLSMFPWAHFRQTKAAVKLHTMIDLRGSIPVFMRITDGSVHDVSILDEMIFKPSSIYVMDREYVDFAWLYRIHQAGAFFVTRAKSNMAFYVSDSLPVDKASGLRCDHSVGLKTAKSKRDYPAKLRRIRFVDPETGKSLVFINNHFGLSAVTIAKIYPAERDRWHIVPSGRRHQQLFFKWIKQNLRIKAFYGTSENAVKTQIWIAICVYLMVACLNKIHGFGEKLSRILQVLSVNAFQKAPLHQLFMDFCTNLDNP